MADKKDFKLELIEFVRCNPILWDSRLSIYKENKKKKSVWMKFKSINDPKREWTSLRNIYMRESRKVRESKKSGSGLEDVYLPSWCYYSPIEVFLKDVANASDKPIHVPIENRESNKTLDESDEHSKTMNTSDLLSAVDLQTESDLPNLGDECYDNYNTENDQKSNIDMSDNKENLNASLNLDVTSSTKSFIKQKKRKHQESNEIELEILNDLRKSIKNKSDIDSSETSLFLRSLKPNLDQMASMDYLEFCDVKMEIMNVIYSKLKEIRSRNPL